MKRAGYIWERFCSLENAVRAIYSGTANKRSDRIVRRIFGIGPGTDLSPDKVTAYARRLVAELEAGTWHHQPGRKKTIRSSGKQREIEIARLKDHFVQWMMILAVEKDLMKRMYRHSFGNIPGRGIHDAMQYIQKHARDGKYKYFVHLDIRHFYQTVDLDLLSEMMHGRFKDARYLAVMDECIYSSAQEGEDGIVRNLAIGFYDSPWFANIYLDPLDRFITEGLYKERRGKRTKLVPVYARYVDDLHLQGNSASDLKKAVKQIIRFCRERLHIEIKANWEICKVGELLPPDEKGKRKLKAGTKKIDMVGYTFSTTDTTIRDGNFLTTRRLAKRIGKRLRERGFVVLQNAQSFVSHMGWFSHADSRTFFGRYVLPIIDPDFVKEVISYASKNGIVGAAARLYCAPGRDGGGYHILYGCC